jgi:imidazolonepropionase-like amidohydrolase
VIGWQDRIGSVENGKFADLIAFPGDPLADITELQRVDVCDEGLARDPLQRRRSASLM